MSFEVTFVQKQQVKKEKTLLKVAQKLDLPIKASCDGKGKCGKCMVRVLAGSLHEPTDTEIKLLGKKKLEQGYRLACEVLVTSDCTVELP